MKAPADGRHPAQRCAAGLRRFDTAGDDPYYFNYHGVLQVSFWRPRRCILMLEPITQAGLWAHTMALSMAPAFMLASTVQTLEWVAIIVVAAFLIVVGVIFLTFFKTWLKGYSAHANVTLWNLVSMRLQGVDVQQLVNAKISLVQAGLDVTTTQLQSHYMAGGRVPNVARALIAAHRASIDMPWSQAAAIDLAGRDVLEAVQTSVNPRVIDVPNSNSGRQTHDGVAKDGTQLRVKARVTVRTNIHQLIGGAGEETVVARVGEGIVAAIGSADTYKVVLENPDMISKTVLSKGLDASTAFQILSVDIADIDVGENVGANQRAKTAEANKLSFQAEAEQRRALAIAQEQENRALAQLNRARVIEAEAQVPLAIAEAFRTGRLGVMDYYRMRNMQADTSMRESLGADAANGDK